MRGLALAMLLSSYMQKKRYQYAGRLVNLELKNGDGLAIQVRSRASEPWACIADQYFKTEYLMQLDRIVGTTNQWRKESLFSRCFWETREKLNWIPNTTCKDGLQTNYRPNTTLEEENISGLEEEWGKDFLIKSTNYEANN